MSSRTDRVHWKRQVWIFTEDDDCLKGADEVDGRQKKQRRKKKNNEFYVHSSQLATLYGFNNCWKVVA